MAFNIYCVYKENNKKDNSNISWTNAVIVIFKNNIFSNLKTNISGFAGGSFMMRAVF